MKYLLPLLLIAFSTQAQVKLPAKIEAEAYSTFKGTEINTDTAADNLGGKYLTYRTGWWTSYYINVLVAGTYTINLRVADGSGGAVNQIRKSDGTIWATFTTPATGGLNSWKTISPKITLSAGKQTFRIVDVSGEYNMDWLEIVPYTDSAKPVPIPAPSGGVSQSDFNQLKTSLDSLRQAVQRSRIKFDRNKFSMLADSTITTKQ